MQYKKQSATSFDEVNRMVWQHLDDRDWFGGTPRSYATSIAIEASELLEHYQWSEKPLGDKDALASELADILIYCFQFAIHTDIDMVEAIQKKLSEASKKYPASSFKGKTIEEKRKFWLETKTNHRANKKGL